MSIQTPEDILGDIKFDHTVYDEMCEHKGYLKFTNSPDDHRSWNVEPEEITVKEFRSWIKKFLKDNDKIKLD